MARLEIGESLLSNDPTSAAQFLVDGKAPELGTRVKLPLLAKTLDHIADQGGRDFTRDGSHKTSFPI